MEKAAKGLLFVLDLDTIAEDGDILDHGPNEFVFLDGIHDVPDGAEVGEGLADLFPGEVASVRVQTLRFRQDPEDD